VRVERQGSICSRRPRRRVARERLRLPGASMRGMGPMGVCFVAFADIARVTSSPASGTPANAAADPSLDAAVLLAIAFRIAGVRKSTASHAESSDHNHHDHPAPLVAILFGSGALWSRKSTKARSYICWPSPSRAGSWSAARRSAPWPLPSSLPAARRSRRHHRHVPGRQRRRLRTLAQVVAMCRRRLLCLALPALSLFTRRALVIGIGYMLVWGAR